jgi:peptide/nickel transport system substrate-binding protein
MTTPEHMRTSPQKLKNTASSKSARALGRTGHVLWLSILVGVALVGCGKPQNVNEPGTINFIIESSPTNLDPRVGTDAQSQYLDGIIFNGLVAHDDQMNVIPDLAERWEQPDPLTYIFHLRTGAKFHDGRTLTSADVKFTFDSVLSGAVKSAKRGTYLMIQSIEAPDDATVIFHLSRPYASFLWNLIRQAIGIVPKGSGTEISKNPIGSGPFRFVSMAQDEEIVLERNKNYFGGTPTPDPSTQASAAPLRGVSIQRIHFRIVPEPVVRALELRKGTADIAEINSLTPDMVVALAKQNGIVTDETPGTTVAYVAMNFDDPILAHREVRQALAYATDRPTLIKYLLRGQGRPAASLLPPNHWAYEPDVKQYDYDPAHAEQLLDAAGFPRQAGGVRFHLQLKTSTEESTRLLSEALAEQWKKVGITLDLRPLENATLQSDIGRGSFQLYTLRWVGANNDPDIFEYVFNSKRMPPNGANRGHYSNPEVDALLAQQSVETDTTKRKVILSQIQKIVAEDEPYLNLWFYDSVCVHLPRVTGIVVPPVGDFWFLTQARVN